MPDPFAALVGPKGERASDMAPEARTLVASLIGCGPDYPSGERLEVVLRSNNETVFLTNQRILWRYDAVRFADIAGGTSSTGMLGTTVTVRLADGRTRKLAIDTVHGEPLAQFLDAVAGRAPVDAGLAVEPGDPIAEELLTAGVEPARVAMLQRTLAGPRGQSDTGFMSPLSPGDLCRALAGVIGLPGEVKGRQVLFKMADAGNDMAMRLAFVGLVGSSPRARLTAVRATLTPAPWGTGFTLEVQKTLVWMAVHEWGEPTFARDLFRTLLAREPAVLLRRALLGAAASPREVLDATPAQLAAQSDRIGLGPVSAQLFDVDVRAPVVSGVFVPATAEPAPAETKPAADAGPVPVPPAPVAKAAPKPPGVDAARISGGVNILVGLAHAVVVSFAWVLVWGAVGTLIGDLSPRKVGVLITMHVFAFGLYGMTQVVVGAVGIMMAPSRPPQWILAVCGAAGLLLGSPLGLVGTGLAVRALRAGGGSDDEGSTRAG